MKIMYLTARQPYPVIKGDQIIAYEQIKELSKKNEIYLISFYEGSYERTYEELSKYCKSVYLIRDNKIKKITSMMKTLYNFKSIQANCFYRYSVNKKLKQIYKEFKPDVVHVQSFRMAEYFINQKINKSIDLIDAYSLNMLKRVKISNFILKPLWYLEYMLLKNYEQQVLENYNKKTIVALRDKQYLKDKSIIVNPNGTSIDTAYVLKKRNQIKGDSTLNIIFQGNMSYYPNVQAVEFLVEALFPKIRKKYPQAKIFLVGGKPSNKILKYKSDNIIVTGYVDKMEDYLAIADIAIYPIFSATGIQNKVLEAMAAGIPCIISKQCSDGIKEVKNYENVMIAINEDEYINCIDELISNNILRKNLIENSLKLVKSKYSWKGHVNKLMNLWIENKKG